MLRALAIILMIVLAPGLAKAQQSRLSNTSGGKLMHVCAPDYGPARYNSTLMSVRVCEAYITGIYDALSQMQSSGNSAVACVPDSVNAVAIRQQVVMWLGNHPEDAQKQASAVVLHVLHEAYPCNGPPSQTFRSTGNVVKMPSFPPPPTLKLPPMPTPGDTPPRGTGAGSANSDGADTQIVPNAPSSDIISIPDSP